MVDQLQGWIAEGRRSLAQALDALSDEEWTGPSLCEGWTVAHVVAHLTMPFRYSTGQVLWGIAKAGGRFARYSDGVAERDATIARRTLVDVLRDHADDPWTPPGGGLIGALTHDTVHGLDATWRAAGGPWRPSDDALRATLDSSVGPKSLRHFGVTVDGLRLEATDLEWAHGAGDDVRRLPATDLLLLLTGRAVRAGVA